MGTTTQLPYAVTASDGARQTFSSAEDALAFLADGPGRELHIRKTGQRFKCTDFGGDTPTPPVKTPTPSRADQPASSMTIRERMALSIACAIANRGGTADIEKVVRNVDFLLEQLS